MSEACLDMAAAIRRRHGGAVTAICQTAWTDWLQAPMQHPLDAVEAGLVKVAGVQLGDHHSHLLHAQRARQLQRRESSWRACEHAELADAKGAGGAGGSPFMRATQAQHRFADVCWNVGQQSPQSRAWACSRVWPPPAALPGAAGSKPASKPPGEPSTISRAASACRDGFGGAGGQTVELAGLP